MKSKSYVYHIVRKQMFGDVLYPLNQLKKIAPELADTYAQKYAGRSELMEKRIPHLGCLWNDVVMFSSVHPRFIFDVIRDEGYDVPTTRFFEIPLSRLDPANTAVHFYSKLKPFGDHQIDETEYAMLADVSYEPLTHLSPLLREHIHIARSEGRPPFMFVGVPHIMYKGSLSIADVSIIEC